MAGSGASGSEETSPDLLKNTPSNIARLEDVIEHSRGRQKYLAQTRSPSDGGDVRWYFCKVPLAANELSASVPRVEIVEKGEYFRFGMRDSLAIEASFLQREEELLSSWWKEFAECSEGPGQQAHSKNQLNSEDDHMADLYEIEEERVGVPVKGGLYEVDLVRRHSFPVYWSGENRRVLRGHWFARKGGLDWLPLREDVAEQLEIAYRRQVWHRRTFQPSGLFAARVDLQGSTPGLYALFTGEDDTWEAWLNMDSSGFTSFVNFSGSGIKLRRGYFPSNSPKPTQDEIRQQKEEEMDDYCSQVPVRHLVFMVHGIGQRLEKSNLVDDVGNFRHITASLAEVHLTSHQRGTQRVLFIPCQWRKGLKLSGETAVEKITLDGVRGLRVMLSATVHDVLYYMSPIYCQDIIDSVTNQLNRLYLKFLKRNPGYDGEVSIYGHSLGSVLSYDILCHQEYLSGPFPMKWMYEEHAETQGNSFDTKDKAATSNVTADQEDGNHDFFNDTKDMTSIDKDDISMAQLPDSATTQIISSETDSSIEAELNSEDNGDKMSDSGGDGDKDSIIKRLKEEVESLKTKIAAMESRGDGDTCHGPTYEHPTSPKLHPEQDDVPKSYTPYIKYTKLEFKVDTFFCVGSPLGVFLSLRNIRIGIGKGKEYWDEENISEEMPACRQMFNIFHPFDPVAYRIEPLVCKEYISKRPALIPYHRGGKRLHIGFQEFAEDLTARSHAVVGHLNYVKVKVLTLCQSKNLDGSEDESCQEKEERSYGSFMIERLSRTEGGRIDHMLQDKTFEHPYLQAIGSHTNYWRDKDTALFILKHLYRDIAGEPNPRHESRGKNPKDMESEDPTLPTSHEQLPLLFSEKATNKNFSKKPKSMRK